MDKFFNQFRVHLHFAGKGKYILLAVLAVYFLIGSVKAESIADILDDDQIQYLQEHKDQLWAKELVSLYDAGTELLNLDFYNGIKSYISYMRDSDAYMDDMLGGGTVDDVPIEDSTEYFSYNSGLYDIISSSNSSPKGIYYYRNGNLTGSVGFDTYSYSADVNGVFFTSVKRERYYTGGGSTIAAYFVNGSNASNNIFWAGSLACSSNYSGGLITIYSTDTKPLKFTCNKDCKLLIDSQGFIIDYITINGVRTDDYICHAGDIVYIYVHVPRLDITSTARQWYIYSVTANAGGGSSEPVERPIFDINSFMPPNIYNYPSSSSAIYNYDNSIYNDIVNNYYTNEKNMDVQEVIAGRGDYTPELDDTVDILTYPLDVFKSMMSAIKDGYTGNFYLHINNVTWHDMTLLPQIDVDIDPRSILGDFFNFLSYVMLFGLTFPWIMHLYSNVRMLVGGGD